MITHHTPASLDRLQDALAARLGRSVTLDFAEGDDGVRWGVWDDATDEVIGVGETPEQAVADAEIAR